MIVVKASSSKPDSFEQRCQSLSPQRSDAPSRRGAAAVEFAVAMSVLAVFIFAGIEFYRLSMVRHHADSAAYEAARLAFVPGAKSEDAVAAATDYLNRVGVTATSIAISPDPITETTAHIEVQIQVPMDANSWAASPFTAGKSLVGRSRLMTERAPIILANAMPVPPPPPPPEPDPDPDPDPDPPPPPPDDDEDEDDDDDPPPPSPLPPPPPPML